MSYRLLPRDAVSSPAGTREETYGQRFSVVSSGLNFYFSDVTRPHLGCLPHDALAPCATDRRTNLFINGFLRPVLAAPAAAEGHATVPDLWQHPAPTEQMALASHATLPGPVRDPAGTVHVYVGLPWSALIDRQSDPAPLLASYREAIDALVAEADPLGVAVRWHSVCQHGRWRD